MRLRRLRRSDFGYLGWLTEVATDTRYEKSAGQDALIDLLDRPDVLIDSDRRGVVAVAIGTPDENSATIDFLAVDPERRRLGTGGRLALATERRVQQEVRTLFARVPMDVGLALYFWLRLGYRPLTSTQRPARLNSSDTWMVRDLP